MDISKSYRDFEYFKFAMFYFCSKASLETQMAIVKILRNNALETCDVFESRLFGLHFYFSSLTLFSFSCLMRFMMKLYGN